MYPDQKFTDAEIAFIAALKEDSGMPWEDIADKFNNKFKQAKTSNAVRKGYERAKDRIAGGNAEYVKLFRSVNTTKKNNSLNAKDLKYVLNAWDAREDILEAIKSAAKDVNKVKPLKVAKSSKGKPNMTMELLISDVHFGKYTDTFDLAVLKRRLAQLSSTVVKEMQKASLTNKIDRVILAFMGDMIESSTMHGTESAKGCEFGNSRQIQECLVHCFQLIVVPIAQAAASYGATVDCIGVTGNHDRTDEHRTFSRVGEENVTWIIYNTMKEFTRLAGLKGVSWQIPVDPYLRLEIYDEGVLYEHYDNAKGNSRVALESLLAKRVNQIKKPIRFMRGGHFHEPTEYGVGKIIINGNVPGNDGYSTSHGFDCEPTQTLNFYIEREKSDSVKRETSFYKRMLVQLN